MSWIAMRQGLTARCRWPIVPVEVVFGSDVDTSRDMTDASTRVGSPHDMNMSNPHLSTTLAVFVARIYGMKSRLVAVPAEVWRRLALERGENNHILLVSLRPKAVGR